MLHLTSQGVLTFTEAAAALRCSKAHLSHIITGKISGLPVLPIMRIGRRVLIRHSALVEWMRRLEGNAILGPDLNSSLETHGKD